MNSPWWTVVYSTEFISYSLFGYKLDVGKETADWTNERTERELTVLGFARLCKTMILRATQCADKCQIRCDSLQKQDYRRYNDRTKKNHICFENTQRRSPIIHIWCHIYSHIKWSCCLDRFNFRVPDVDVDVVSASWFLQVYCIYAWTESSEGSWPWPLTYDLDIRTQPRYAQPRLACQRRTHTHTHTNDVKTITLTADAGCNQGIYLNTWVSREPLLAGTREKS